jgi:hypothetical protein
MELTFTENSNKVYDTFGMLLITYFTMKKIHT